MTVAAGAHLGPYEVLAPLGAGGMGEVYRARDPRLDREVAIKVLPEEVSQDSDRRHRFEREARAAGSLDHPNVLVIHEVGTHEGALYVVSELLEGETLRERLARGPCGMDEAVGYAAQVGNGLAAAHGKGVIHRDLKPENLFLTTGGRVKILDFGLAKVTHPSGPVDPEAETASATTGTEPGTVMGTAGYMSPEQVRGQSVDHRSDVFSFGVVLYELLGGSHPFGRETPADALAAILTREPTDLGQLKPELPPALVGVVGRCLEKEPWRRYATAQELVYELEHSLSEDAELVSAIAGPEFLSREGETPREEPVFVAREAELARLRGGLERAFSGEGQVFFVTGDAGSGKTALVNEFARWAQAEHLGLVVAGGKCNAHTGMGDPYLPFREVLGLLTGDVETVWAAGAITRDQALRLWRVVPDSVQALVDSGPDLVDTFVPGRVLISRARSSGVGGRPAWLVKLRQVVEQKAGLPAPQTPQQSDLFEQYTRVLQAVAAEHPVLLVLDDLQWADAGSISLLFHMGRQLRGSRVLITGIYRGSEVALGRGGERHPLEGVVNELKRDLGDVGVELGEPRSREFVDALLDTEPNELSESFRDTLYRQTNGHPLFTVELLQGMQEQGALTQDDSGRWVEGEDLDWESLPARVEAVIAERVGRLPGDLRELLSVASVEGETFTAELLARLLGSVEREVARLLSKQLDQQHRLVSAQGLRRLNGQHLSSYRFRHILFQKYLYGSLDTIERARLHEDVGTGLEALHAEHSGEIAVQLARHFEEAGIASKAVNYLRLAGEAATRVSANEEAIALLQRALATLEELPHGADRALEELSLQLDLMAPLAATTGYAGRGIQAAGERARVLCEQVGERPQLFLALTHLATFYAMLGRYSAALDLARRCVELGRHRWPDTEFGHHQMGWLLTACGELQSAREHLETSAAFYDGDQHGGARFVLGLDPAVASRVWLAVALWLLGFPDRAREIRSEALNLARQTDHPMSLALGLLIGHSFLMPLEQQPASALALADELLEVATRARLLFYQAAGLFFRGGAEALGGEPLKGIEDMRQANDAHLTMGIKASLGQRLAVLADACLRSGRATDALGLLDEAVAFIAESGEGYWAPEVHRLKGATLLQRGAESDAEASFDQAIEVARHQQARALELRAVTSLARLWHQQGRTEQARERLSEIYGWFTEGFDTPDLEEAKVLLDTLGG